VTQQDRTLDITLRRVDRGPALARRATIDHTDYLAFMADSHQQLYTVAGNGPIAVSGSPYARYQGQLDVGEPTEVEACLPFWAEGRKPTLTGDVFVSEPGPELFASAVFVGAATVFPAVHQAYDAVAGWILRHGFEFASPAYEIYRQWHGAAGHPGNRLEIGWAVAENAA
jgi:hypothetical protein